MWFGRRLRVISPLEIGIYLADSVKSLSGVLSHLYFFPNDLNQDWSILKAFADGKINVNEKLKFVLGRVENIMGKGENTCYQHFLLFPRCFQKPSVSGSLNVVIVG